MNEHEPIAYVVEDDEIIRSLALTLIESIGVKGQTFPSARPSGR